MCGRYVVATPFQQLALDFGAVAETEFAAHYNLAPTAAVPVLWQRAEDEGVRRLDLARWGLVPYWAKDPGIGVRAFNARIETAADKPMFRGAFVRRRCVLPADGYYEWRKGEGKTKQPMFIHPRDGSRLAFAGLYERWKDAEGRPLWSVSILTGPALGDELASIHDRMPLTVAADRIEAWLDPDLRDADRVRSLLDLDLVPDWATRPVGPAVGNVRNNGPELILPLPGLGGVGRQADGGSAAVAAEPAAGGAEISGVQPLF
jgi:putative SOS response-associated peptidase YedK